MGELLDFKDRGYFDFFNVSSYYGDQKRFKNVLIADCEKVLEYSHKTIQDICLLGYSLKELKESGRWQWVKNPKTGDCFEGGEFAKFSDYAFGFSETKTSDLLRISKFLRVKGENEVYLPERYKDYKTSQLVELASVDDGDLHYFKDEMTVEEMRLVKKYLETSDCWNKRRVAQNAKQDFDALAHAKAWKEQEKQKKNGNKVQPLNEVLAGQITLEELEEVEETPEENPTSDLANSCEEEKEEDVQNEVSEQEREEAIKNALLRGNRIEIYKKYKNNPLHSEFVGFIKSIYETGESSFIGEIYVKYVSKGLTVTKYTRNFKEIFTLFLPWAQVAQRIVMLINNDEYLGPTEKYLIEKQIKKNEERKTNAAESDEDYAEPPEGGYYQGGGLDLDDEDDDEPEEETPEENPTSDLASLCGEEETDSPSEVSEAEKEAAIKEALRGNERKRIEIYRKYKSNPLHSEFVDFIKWIYGTGNPFNGDIDVNYRDKGLTITKYTWNFKEVFTIFLSWAQVAQRIVVLINNDEYLFPTEKYLIEKQIKKNEERKTNAAESDEDYAEPPEGGYYQGGGLDLDDEDDDEPEEETPEENPTSDLAIPCGYDPFDLVKGAAPFLKANLSNRNGIREFYRGFHDWEQIYSTIPFMRVYRYRFKTGTLFAVDFTSGNLLEDKAERKYENNVRYFWDGKEEPIPFEIRIFDLEKYIPLHKDEL